VVRDVIVYPKIKAMKTSKKAFFTVSLLVCAITLLSWTFNKSARQSNSYEHPYLGSDPDARSELQLMTFIDNADRGGNRESDLVPGAEDVLVKRIPGDNNHLIMMVYYSKENYSAPSVTINSGSNIVFKDDGSGYDEKAGDGIYTAKINADVKEFRQQAVQIQKQMKESGYKPYRYIHRELVYDPNVALTFDLQGFDANKAVSIAGITNAVGDVSANAGASTNNSVPTSNNLVSTSDKLATGTSSSATVSKLMAVLATNSIFIRDLGVVEDSTRTWNVCTQTGNVNGPWTFGTLMRQLASKNPGQIATDAQVSDYVKNWLITWISTQIVNGDTVQARTQMTNQIVQPWLSKSKNAGNPGGQLDMRFAPFKLTAITNRFDLRGSQRFTNPTEVCGEGRLMFCLIKSDCSQALPMTVIFEYAINKPNVCDSLKSWAQQWFNLKDLTLGSSAYNAALQAITDQFTLCGTNPAAPDQSSLAQVRTNEITLSPVPKVWELKEFHLDSLTGNLIQATVAQTPADRYDSMTINPDVQRMVQYVNQNASAVIQGTNVVPAQISGFGFLGAASHIIGPPTGIPNPPKKPFHWDGTDSTNKKTFIKSTSARSVFSRETCNGCHAGETQTGFTHVDPVFFGTQATLSGFLTGVAGANGAVDFDGDSTNGKMSVEDAALRPSATNPAIRTFSDITRRSADLKTVVATTCTSVLGISARLMFQPVNSAD
jgi:hypothetical protein